MSNSKNSDEDMKTASEGKSGRKAAFSCNPYVRSAIRQTEIDGKKELDDEGVIAIIGKRSRCAGTLLEESGG